MKSLVDKLSSSVSKIAEEARTSIDNIEVDRELIERCRSTFDETKKSANESLSEATNIVVAKAEEIVSSFHDTKDDTGSSSIEKSQTISEAEEIESSIQRLEGKDKVGVAGEGAAVVGGVLAGTAAAGTIAGAAGATTLLGSSTLAGLLGGVFVTTTPVGWVIGSAALAGAAGYGIAKLIRSGSEQDVVRKELIEQLNQRLTKLTETEKGQSEYIIELNQIITICIAAEVITEDKAEQLVSLVETGKLPADFALKRTKAMAISAGVIEELDS
jgi:hypothetical protein